MGPEHDYPIRPVLFTEVRLSDGFWAPRIETNRKTTIPYAFRQCEETGRIANFALAAGLAKGEHRGEYPFDDTDPYKVLEGASYALAIRRDAGLDRYLDKLIAVIAAAQEPDGYLYTARTNRARHLARWIGPARWVRERGSHELYNAGHLYEAAAAHYEATGKRTLLAVALKNADLVGRVFGPGKRCVPPGHQVIEMGLAKLYRATGESKYLALAEFFLDQRGKRSHGRKKWGEYSQDHVPVLRQRKAVGHAVRATYLYSGMADVAALYGRKDYARALDILWDNVVRSKLYLTGGVGARGDGEAFGGDYELPNASAYSETCAAIGHVYWNHRMFLLHGDAKYVDVMERTLYNGFLSGVSLDGMRFFYPNVLESHGQHERSPWFGCACCPSNVARFIASLPGYVYAARGEDVFVNLFVAGRGRIDLAGGAVQVAQETRYPWDGKVRLTIRPARAGREFAVHVRIPGWARNRPVPSDLYRYVGTSDAQPRLRVNGRAADAEIVRGYACLRRPWRRGDVIELDLPMPVRRVLCHDKVAENRGKVAIERGPIVYCAEAADQPDGRVLDLVLADREPLKAEWRGDLLGGVAVIRGMASAVGRTPVGGIARPKRRRFTAIPYYAWAHRGKGEMAVWIARMPEEQRGTKAGPRKAAKTQRKEESQQKR